MNKDPYDFTEHPVNIETDSIGTRFTFMNSDGYNTLFAFTQNDTVLLKSAGIDAIFKRQHLTLVHIFDDESDFEIRAELDDLFLSLAIPAAVYAVLQHEPLLQPFKRFVSGFDDGESPPEHLSMKIDPRIDLNDIGAIQKGDFDSVIEKLNDPKKKH